MKKIIIGIQILILVLILIKAASVVGLIKKTDFLSATSLMTRQALAESTVASPAAGKMPSVLRQPVNETAA
ncbi:MAG: hypothetical protein ABRQ34_05990, partial [Smithellaceae bacterium]